MSDQSAQDAPDLKSVKVAAVVAMAENNCIGKDNDLPWHIPEDLKRFKALTLGKPVVMGRKTFESIYERIKMPLPGRTNIIVTRKGLDIPDVVVYSDLTEAINKAKEEAANQGYNEIIIGGGAQIYDQALSLCDVIHLTVVHQTVDGDAFFPSISEDKWKTTKSETFEAKNDKPSYTFKTLERP